MCESRYFHHVSCLSLILHHIKDAWANHLILFCASVAAKSGVDPSGCVELARHVKMSCPNLEFSGLMTIGMLDYTSTPENFRVGDLSRVNSNWLKCLI